MSAPKRFCVDCRHYRDRYRGMESMCIRDKKQSLVTGEMIPQALPAQDNRWGQSDGDYWCGPNGNHWERMPTWREWFAHVWSHLRA